MAYSYETKAAVIAALLEGQSVNKVAKEYGVPKGTVSGWKKEAFSSGIPTQKNKEIGNLLIECLTTSLQTLKAQAEQFADVEWLKTQSASDVAVLHGVMTDKAIRLLEAFSSAEN